MSAHLSSILKLEWASINKQITQLDRHTLCNISINGSSHGLGNLIMELVGNITHTMVMMNSIPTVFSDLKGVFNEQYDVKNVELCICLDIITRTIFSCPH
ncbi:hypothetical protein D3C76_1277850 [compost metagenome]